MRQTTPKLIHSSAHPAAIRVVHALGVLTVAYGFWDYHGNNFKNARADLPMLDQAVYALITDLRERGLDKDVSVIVGASSDARPRSTRTPCATTGGGSAARSGPAAE